MLEQQRYGCHQAPSLEDKKLMLIRTKKYDHKYVSHYTHQNNTSVLRQAQVLVQGHKPRWLPNQWIYLFLPLCSRFCSDKVWTKLCRVQMQAVAKQGIFAPESDRSTHTKSMSDDREKPRVPAYKFLQLKPKWKQKEFKHSLSSELKSAAIIPHFVRVQ